MNSQCICTEKWGAPVRSCPDYNMCSPQRMKDFKLDDPDLQRVEDEALQPKRPWRDPLLVERQSTHGSFIQNAAISQQIKGIMKGTGVYPHEQPVFCEALDMIALKLSRILSGQANFADHWADIAGYAQLAKEACTK